MTAAYLTLDDTIALLEGVAYTLRDEFPRDRPASECLVWPSFCLDSAGVAAIVWEDGATVLCMVARDVWEGLRDG